MIVRPSEAGSELDYHASIVRKGRLTWCWTVTYHVVNVHGAVATYGYRPDLLGSGCARSERAARRRADRHVARVRRRWEQQQAYQAETRRWQGVAVPAEDR